MKFKPGCGCLLLVLGAGNLLFVASIFYGIVTAKIQIALGLGCLAIFVGNIAVCLRTFQREMRGGTGKESSEAAEDEGEGEVQGEGVSQQTADEEDN